MPSKGTLSKLRVKQRKRTFLSKNAKRKTRAVKSLRKKRKSMKKLMMGGAFGSAGFGSTFKDQGWSNKPSSSSSTKEEPGFAIILYDDIGLSKNNEYKVPIYIFFMKYNSVTKDDIYIFFNKNVTDVEITDTVKAFFSLSSGIDENSINIGNPIKKSSELLVHEGGNLWTFISDTFVKIQCPFGNNGNYRLESGTINNGGLLQIQTTDHNMTTDIPAIKREDVKKIIEGENFVKKIKDKVQPELYKTYVPLINKNYNKEDISVNERKEYNKKMKNRKLDKVSFGMVYGEKYNAKEIMTQIENAAANRSWYKFNFDVIKFDEDDDE